MPTLLTAPASARTTSPTLPLPKQLKNGARRHDWLWLTLCFAFAAAGCGTQDDTQTPATEATSPASSPRVTARALTAARSNQGNWSAPSTLPLVPAAASNLPDGKVLLWAAEDKFRFDADAGLTYFATLDPSTGAVSERTVSETGHNMFCPGTTNLADGRLLVSGGLSAAKTSIFDPSSGQWSRGAQMNIPRGYQANTLLQNGSVLTLGGSWSGAMGGKDAEIWSPDSGAWRTLRGIPIEPFYSANDPAPFGGDSHFMLFSAGNGKVFHAGPGVNMHWLNPNGDGAYTPAGRRGDDEYSINGNAVMYDSGKILKVGGAPGYASVNANANSYLIDISAGVTVRKIAPMSYKRAFHNSVVLPNGQVMVLGGQTYAFGFSDNNSVLVPELFDPVTETFSILPPMAVPRNYHSVALLLPDARVLSGGGGLCGEGCAANHPDVQIYTPHYLLNADGSPAVRPSILQAPSKLRYGQTASVQTDGPVTAFALVRMSSSTHTVNNDQRRIALSFSPSDNSGKNYNLALPSNPGWALPGDWMLFAMNAQGTPSVAKIVRLDASKAPQIAAIENQYSASGTATTLQPKTLASSGTTLRFGARGLPPGLTFNSSTGQIQGTPNAAGVFPVQYYAASYDANNAQIQRVHTEFLWTVSASGTRPLVNRAPTLNTPAAQIGTQGQAISFQLSASDPDGDTLIYSANALPPGLTIDSKSGLISGTLGSSGSYTVSVTADDQRGSSSSSKFLWTTLPTLPQIRNILTTPIEPNSDLSLTMELDTQGSTSGNYQYQWDFGDGSSSTWNKSPYAGHSYAHPGVYHVTASVRTEDGRVSTRSYYQAVVESVASTSAAIASSPIITTPAKPNTTIGARIWVVNPDNDSVGVLDATTLSRIAEIPVGSQPSTLARAPDGRIWVANKGASSLSVLDENTLRSVQTIALARASQPHGIIISPSGWVYVAHEASGHISRLSSTPNPNPTIYSSQIAPQIRHLALRLAGPANPNTPSSTDQLLVSRYISPPLPGEGSAHIQTTLNGQAQGGELHMVDANNLSLQKTLVLRTSDRSDTTLQGRGIPNYLGAPALAPDGKSAWIPSKQDNVQRGKLRDGRNLNFENTVRAIVSRIDLNGQKEDYPARTDLDNSGLASAALYHPGGAYLFVALETSRHIAVLDAQGRRELFRVDTGRAPQGLSLAEDGRTLYVHNFMDRTVGAYDLSALLNFGENQLPLRTSGPTLGVEKLSPQILRGKQLFYDASDARLARDAYLSCASCHSEGGHDGRTWDMTGFGEGLRNTISLRGRAGAQGKLHWSGNFDEIQDFEQQIRNLAQGSGLLQDAVLNTGSRAQPLGDKKAGLSPDLDALAAYVASLATFAPSPWRDTLGNLTAPALAGRSLFTAQCATCHGSADFSDSKTGQLHNIGTLKPSSGLRSNAPLTGIDSPTLRDVWATAPYLHDGSAATLEDAIRAHSSLNLSLSANDLSNLSAYLKQIGAEEAPPNTNPNTSPNSNGLLLQYFANTACSGQPSYSNNSSSAAYNWSAAPAPGLPSDGFSVRFSGHITAPTSGSYRFQTASDEGVRVWLDGRLIIDHWTPHTVATALSPAITLSAGQKNRLRIEHYDLSGPASLYLRWQTPGKTQWTLLPSTVLSAP